MTLKGKFTEAKIFSDTTEQEALNQIQELINEPFMEGSKVRIMPDVHAGKGCTIGTTFEVKDKICPNLVGVDVGCGVLTIEFSVGTRLNLEYFDKLIHDKIPAGKNIRKDVYPEAVTFLDYLWSSLKCASSISNRNRINLSLGTLGGGNHFIELGEMDRVGSYYLSIHTGSRNLGKQVAEHYQALAEKQCFDFSKEVEKEIILLKSDCAQHYEITGELLLTNEQIGEEINKIKEKYAPKVSNKDLSYLEGESYGDYLSDMELCQFYAKKNRYAIWGEISSALVKDFLFLEVAKIFDTVHNYIDVNEKGIFLRKGAIAAYKGETVLIPMNMRDGSIVAVGKGNEDWNYSAPHGAGRLMSRSKARQTVGLKEYEKSMEGIYTTCVNESTVDESPMAYKPMDEILSKINETVDVKGIIKPVYNFKASE